MTLGDFDKKIASCFKRAHVKNLNKSWRSYESKVEPLFEIVKGNLQADSAKLVDRWTELVTAFDVSSVRKRVAIVTAVQSLTKPTDENFTREQLAKAARNIVDGMGVVLPLTLDRKLRLAEGSEVS